MKNNSAIKQIYYGNSVVEKCKLSNEEKEIASNISKLEQLLKEKTSIPTTTPWISAFPGEKLCMNLRCFFCCHLL